MYRLNGRSIILCLIIGAVGALMDDARSLFRMDDVTFILMAIVMIGLNGIIIMRLKRNGFFDSESNAGP